jgi:hypothetical protein
VRLSRTGTGAQPAPSQMRLRVPPPATHHYVHGGHRPPNAHGILHRYWKVKRVGLRDRNRPDQSKWDSWVACTHAVNKGWDGKWVRAPMTPARAGIERIRGSSTDSALETLLIRELVAFNEARLYVTTRAFLDFAGLRDRADLPPLQDLASDDANQAWGARM